MARVKTYSPTELNAMDLSELVKVVNRQAERYNKQITRAQEKGYNLSEIFGQGRKRLTVMKNYKEPKRQSTIDKERARLIGLYEAREEKAQGGYTVSNIKSLEKEKKQLEKEVFNQGGISWETFRKFRDTAKDARSVRALYYELMQVAVNNEVIPDYSPKSKRMLTPSDETVTMSEINDALRHIVDNVNASLDDEELDITMHDLKEAAARRWLDEFATKEEKAKFNISVFLEDDLPWY